MIDLHDQLRAAADAPPPTRIHLDALIAREVRRRRTLRWAGASAALAALAALAVAAPLALGGAGASLPGADAAGARPCPTAGAPGPQQSHAKPRPTERCADAVVRLAAALGYAIEKAAPDLGVTPVEFVYVPVRLRYQATVTLTGPTSRDVLRVELIASNEHPDPHDIGCVLGCDYRVDDDGTVVAATRDGRQRQVAVYRPDGTAVLVLVDAAPEAAGPRSGLTDDQVEAIARAPGLTLFPKAQPVPTAAAPAPAASAARQDATAVRLTAALRERLAAALPGAKFVDPVDESVAGRAPYVIGSRASGYKAGVDIADADGVSHLNLGLFAQRPPCAEPSKCGVAPVCPTADGATHCTIAPDGTKVVAMSRVDGKQMTSQVELYRPDGSIVQLGLTNIGPDPSPEGSNAALRCDAGTGRCDRVGMLTVTRKTLPLTIDQLVEIGGALRL
jgi:hypothetical protein